MNLKLTTLSRVAAVSAVALMIGTWSSPSWAVAYELDSDNPITIPVTATVNESVDVTTTDMNLGSIGVHQDKSTGGTGVATLTMDPDNTIHDTPDESAAARLIGETATGTGYVAPAAASVDVTGAFPGALIYEHYENVVDLACTGGACNSATTPQGTPDAKTIKFGTGSSPNAAYVAPGFQITDIQDSLGSPIGADVHGASGAYTPVQGHWVKTPAANTDGEGVTDPTGELLWHIGATIATVPGASYYASGTYHGSFDITLSY